jgi:exopolyphosphatase / guanosine-5'-triphosphate,3'-diphosphate pyrophosphatase
VRLSTRLAAYACIDIGSNTTRLLVAEPGDNGLRELMTQRVFTRLGRTIRAGDGAIPEEKLSEEAHVVATQVRHARELGAREIRIVATAAIRQAPNREELVRAIEASTGLAPAILTDAEEARLAFLGASRTLGSTPDGTLGVLDVGGGSTELAAGNAADGVSWFASFSIGSGFLADSYFRSDPPSPHDLQAAEKHAKGCFEGLDAPAVERAVAVGGSATALRRVAGGELSHEALERAVRILSTAPSAEVAERFELDAERVRLLPAGVLIIDAVSDAVGWRLKIGGGGLREGCILEMATGAP